MPSPKAAAPAQAQPRTRAPAYLSANDLIEINTGWAHSPDRWREAQDRRDQLAEQTRDLAARLERIGISAMVETDFKAIGAVTGIIDAVEAYRAVKFLPIIAQRDRRPMLNALRFYQRNKDDGRYMRYAVVTAGVVIEAGGPLKEAAKRLKKNISRWAAEADSTYGVHVLFRGVEFTRKRGDEAITGKHGQQMPSLHQRDPVRFKADAYYYHVHANVLYRPRPGIDKAMWRQFLRWSRIRLGRVAWKDNGKLKRPEEAIKYSFKPQELGNISVDELRWLYHQTFRQNDMQPMGRFKAFRAELEENVAKDESGAPVLDETGEPVKERLKVATVRRKKGAVLEIVKKRKPDFQPVVRDLPADPLAPKGKRENLVMTVTAPHPRHTPWSEPVILVAGYTDNPSTFHGCDGFATIQRIREQARAAWDANGAPPPEIAIATGRAWRAATTAEEAGKVVALARQNRASERAARAAAPSPEKAPRSGEAAEGAFNVHTCRLSAQAPEGAPGVADGGPGAQPPAPRHLRAVAVAEDGTAYDPDTGEVIEVALPEVVDDRVSSALRKRSERDENRTAKYRAHMQARWRERSARKQQPKEGGS